MKKNENSRILKKNPKNSDFFPRISLKKLYESQRLLKKSFIEEIFVSYFLPFSFVIIYIILPYMFNKFCYVLLLKSFRFQQNISKFFSFTRIFLISFVWHLVYEFQNDFIDLIFLFIYCSMKNVEFYKIFSSFLLFSFPKNLKKITENN